MTSNTVTHSDHVCEDFPHSKRMLPKYRNYYKRDSDNSGIDGFLFTCGGCQIKFKTVCLLHIHIESHQEGGSYSYDHITRTAFPKYDSICACTQVEEHIFQLLKLNPIDYEENNYSIGIYSGTLEENADKRTRKSKRIARRKDTLASICSCSDGLKNLVGVINRPESDTGDFPAATNKHNSQRKIDGTENETGKNTETEIMIYRGNSSNRDQIECPSGGAIGTRDYDKKKRKHHKNVHSIHLKTTTLANASVIEHITEIDGETANISNSKVIEVNIEDTNGNELTDRREKLEMEQVHDLKSFENKTDEITASEALITISKGLNNESSNTNENTRTTDKIKLHSVDTNTSKVKSDVVTISISKQDATIPERVEVQIGHREQAKQDNKGNKTEQSFVKEESVEISDLKDCLKQRSAVHEKYIKQECPTCGKVGSRTMVSYHKYIHKEAKELSCDKCGKQFQHPACLKIHLRCHEEKGFKCDICPAQFHRRKYLETHMLMHSGEKPYMCETCGKAYRDAMHLKRHIRHVHEQIRKFECDICKERFFRTDHLKNHRLRHFEPVLKCKFCPRKFKLQIDLDRHLIVHSGENTLHCHHCGHGFRYPMSYYQHMQKRHNVDREEAVALRKKMVEEHKKNQQKQLGKTSQVIDDSEPDASREFLSLGIKVEATNEIYRRNNVEVRPNSSGIGKMYLKQLPKDAGNQTSYNSSDNVKDGAFDDLETLQIDLSDSESTVLKTIHRSNNNTCGEHVLCQQQTSKGYRLFRISTETVGTTKSVFSDNNEENHSEKTVASEDGLQFPLKDSFQEAEDDETGAGGIVGFENGSHLQDDEMLVIGEETVQADLGVMSQYEGENMQAVMFIDDNECACEVVIDQENAI